MSLRIDKNLVPVVAALAMMTMASPATATDTSFAQYSSTNKAFIATDALGLFKLSESADATFSFLNTNLATTVNGVAAHMSLTAQAPNSDFGTATFLGQTSLGTSGLTGKYVFTSTKAYTIGNTTFAKGANLLTVTFSGATLSGALHSPNATFEDFSTQGGTVTYTSDFLSFANAVSTDFSVSLGAVNPTLGGTHSLNPFKATPTGTFSSDPVPVSIAVVPEPATWMMILVGLGSIGLGLRGRTRRTQRPA